LGILAVGTIGEQIKTRLEVAAEKAGTSDVDDAKEVRGQRAYCQLAVVYPLPGAYWLVAID
jgi:hypothetical protein